MKPLSLALTVLCACASSCARGDALSDVLGPGEAGFGFTARFERSPYRGGEREPDTLPQPVFDSRHVHLQSNRAAFKLERDRWRTELFVQRRYEGFALDRVPTSALGMAPRERSADVGFSIASAWKEGEIFGEVMRDVGQASRGSELRLGYRYERWWSGRLRLRPYVTAALRDARLNNYYYGVRAQEATAERPAYEPGSGVDLELGLQSAYRLTERWQVLGGLGLTRPSSGVQASPVVENGTRPSATLGLMYGLPSQPAAFGERRPLIVRAFHGASTECGFLRIVALTCSGRHEDGTSVSALEVGQRLVERANGWPLDFAGFVGLLRHEERGAQPDFWQLNGYLKVYYYGFPWRAYVRTRLGFGAGASYASRVPFNEAREQARRGRDTSKLVFYMDPTIDASVGDLLRTPPLRDTYLGIGVSHRSGIFGWSDAFNNVNGGSNYIYGYVESTF